MEEGGHLGGGCRGTCRRRTAGEAPGSGRRLPLRRQRDAGE